MHSDNFDISTYFKRINYTGPAAADTGTLHALMRHQLFAIPFENLDVQAGKIVSLAPDDIADKLLTQGRGGYCYEVNGLFAMALEALGIPYRFVAARPMFYPVRRPKTHMALIAEVESRQWLCDLGFGSYGIRAPMALDTLDVDIAQDFDTFRLSCSAEGEYLLQAKVAGEWASQYGFDLTPQEWIDFVPANYLKLHAPGCHFCAEACGGAASTGGTRDFTGGYAENHYGEGHGNPAVGGGRHPPYSERAFCVDRGVKQKGACAP